MKFNPEYQKSRKKLYEQVQKELPEELKRLEWSREKILQNQESELRKLIKFAKEKSIWHAKNLKNFNADTITLKDLTKIPPMSKTDIMDNWDDMITTDGITKKIATDYLNKIRIDETINPYYEDKAMFFATGGSSGERGIFVWEKKELPTFCKCVCRYEVKDELKRPISNKKVAILAAPMLVHASTVLFSTISEKGTQQIICPTNLPIDEICKQLNEFQPTHLNGFSSMIKELSQCQLKGKLNIKPSRVVVSSEPLDEAGSESIKKAWGIDSHRMWGSVEIGVAGSGILNENMYLLEDYNILETVDENLQPTNDIKNIHKLLVTNFYNTALPLIRYIIDDILEIDEPKHGNGYRSIKSILGRDSNNFIYKNGKSINPLYVNDVISNYSDIESYQVQQTETGMNVDIECSSEETVKSLRNDLIGNIQNALGKDSTLTVKKVQQIPRHPETGKIKYYVPLKKST